MVTLCALLVLLRLASAHTDHSFDLDDANDAGMSYAERHMHTEHHIDSFDLPSFFKLHDLNQDGVWDEAEIEAVYGLHHHSIKDKVPEPETRDDRTRGIVESVLVRLDKNRDGKITLQEFVEGGTEGLPSFEGYKDLGHHYDEESEYFLHHEELYHSTPETQTDEAYSHAEDIEHFRHHAHIEAEEDARERQFEGLPADADLSKDHVIADPLEEHAHAPGEGPLGDAGSAQHVYMAGDEAPPPLRFHREDPGASPNRLGRSGQKVDREEWDKAKTKVKDDHGKARSAEDRLRRGSTYKSKFRKGLRSDEF